MLRLRFPQKVVRFGLLFAEGRKVVFEVAKMRVTYHNGRSNKQGVYSSRHNDRNFEIENASHIEPEQIENNAYWHIYQNESPQMSFDAVEEKFYGEHFGEFLEARNNRYLAQRQKKRVQSMTDYRKSQKSCPEETLFQVGNVSNKISKEKMCRIFNEYIHWQNKQYPQLITLNCAYHADEQGAGHIHIRQVWIAHNGEGREMVHQGQSLAEMGVQRPKPEKKESRYNNAKMVFTKKSREKIIEIARSFGIEIEDKPLEASKTGKDLIKWQTEQDEEKAEEAKANLQKANAEHKEILNEIAKAEVYLAETQAETEKEKKRAEEIKALADAENKRLADLRGADAECQRLFEIEENARQQRLQELKKKETETQERLDTEKKKLQNFKVVADKRMDEIMDELEATIAKTDKAKKEVEEITKKKVKVEAEYNQLSVDVSQLQTNKDFLTYKNGELLEYQQQIMKDNRKYEVELHTKADELNRAESIISEAKSAEWQLNFLRTQIPSAQKELEEIKTKKEKSIEIISQVAEPVLNVSEAIQSKNKNKLWIAVQGLVKAFGAIDIPFFKVMWENRELIENQQFDEAYQNLCEAEPELTAEERGLKFLRSVTRKHSINNYNIISNAIRAVADAENKDTAFEVQLSQMLRQTDIYKSQQQNTKKQEGWRYQKNYY